MESVTSTNHNGLGDEGRGGWDIERLLAGAFGEAAQILQVRAIAVQLALYGGETRLLFRAAVLL